MNVLSSISFLATVALTSVTLLSGCAGESGDASVDFDAQLGDEQVDGISYNIPQGVMTCVNKGGTWQPSTSTCMMPPQNGQPGIEPGVCPANQQLSGIYCYPLCPPNTITVGLLCRNPSTGQTTGRGGGVPASCPAGTIEYVGLCVSAKRITCGSGMVATLGPTGYYCTIDSNTFNPFQPGTSPVVPNPNGYQSPYRCEPGVDSVGCGCDATGDCAGYP